MENSNSVGVPPGQFEGIQKAAIFLAIILPVLITFVLSYTRTKKDLTEYTFARLHTIAQTAAIAVKEQLDRLSDLGISLATRIQFVKLINAGKWNEALKIMESVPQRFPAIERIFITDVHGVLRADIPPLGSARGLDLSFLGWYRGVSQNWEPYLSSVYTRLIKPQYNVIAIANPIKDESDRVSGILVLQVKVDRLFKWVKEIEVGPSGFIYVVDRNGTLAEHPLISVEGKLINHISVPVVQKALQGKSGVEISFNPIEKENRISAYEPVAYYGWAVIVQEPTVTAFAPLASNLRILIYIYVGIFLISSFLAVVITRSLSRRHQLFQEQTARIEAEKAIRLRDDFISISEHELKTPLTSLRMQLQIIPRYLIKTSAPRFDLLQKLFNYALYQLDQFSGLVDNLLDVSRASAGRLTFEPKMTDLSQLVHHAVNQHRLQLTEAGCTVEENLVRPIRGCWDPLRIQQVIINLLTNAMKFGRGKPIQIRTWIEEDVAKVMVRDFGIGIAKANQRKIFERFERVVPITGYGGFGLGLYITYEIVKGHGGSIRVESELGKGATFIVDLPLHGETRPGT